MAFDRAVEHGRSEERTRLAQDLHDDIGARLLTMMYKATSPEMEDYVRHTLQDLKTLTRGLAALEPSVCRTPPPSGRPTSRSGSQAARIELDWTVVARGRHRAQRRAVVGADAHPPRAGEQHHLARRGQLASTISAASSTAIGST